MGNESVRVRLFGPLEVQRCDENGAWKLVEKEDWGKPKHARSVLKRLLTAPGRRMNRVQIQDDLWPEMPEQADSYLWNAINKVRGAIGRNLLRTEGPVYELADQSQIWTDLDDCEHLMCAIENKDHTTRQAMTLLEAVLSYLQRGICLEGEDGIWCYGPRRKSEDMLRQCRIWLAEAYEEQGKLWQAGEQYRAQLTTTPFDEGILQIWMAMLVRHEKAQEALKHYQDIKEQCKQQGCALSAEIEQFVTQIRSTKSVSLTTPAQLSHSPVPMVGEAGALVGITEKTKGLWADDLLTIYAQGIAACQDLYFGGQPHQVERLLPLYRTQTGLLVQRGPLQRPAACLASLSEQIACELLTDREDFGAAQQAGQQALLYAQIAGDRNLQVASLISLANLGFHRKQSTAALHAYQQAISLFNERVTPLLRGRTYAGIAEVYAMRREAQESLRAMGLAYEHYPLRPEDDPAYPYLRASRYALFVFGDAQSHLFLRKPKEAEKALIAVARESHDPETEPVTRLDLLYYQAEAQVQQRELEASSATLTEAATLARDLGSRLYYNKLVATFEVASSLWPRETVVTELEEVFQAW